MTRLINQNYQIYFFNKEKAMTDLTAITDKFEELDIETQMALVRRHREHGDVEESHDGIKWQKKMDTNDFRTLSFHFSKIYRQKPFEVIPDTINVAQAEDDMELMDRDIKWMARDENGTVLGYGKKPNRGSNYWWTDYTVCDLYNHKSLRIGNLPWHESLVDLDALRAKQSDDPDTINALEVADHIKWMARDKNGYVAGHERMPRKVFRGWEGDSAYFDMDSHKSLKIGNLPWGESLVDLDELRMKQSGVMRVK